MAMAGKRAVTLSTSTPVNLRVARTCYDHLAGEVAVSLYDFMLREAWIASDGTALTPAGEAHFTRLGVTVKRISRRKGRARLSGLERTPPSPWRGGWGGAAAARSPERLVYHHRWISRSDDYAGRMARVASAFSVGGKIVADD